jgi:hypothetical protein
MPLQRVWVWLQPLTRTMFQRFAVYGSARPIQIWYRSLPPVTERLFYPATAMLAFPCVWRPPWLLVTIATKFGTPRNVPTGSSPTSRNPHLTTTSQMCRSSCASRNVSHASFATVILSMTAVLWMGAPFTAASLFS